MLSQGLEPHFDRARLACHTEQEEKLRKVLDGAVPHGADEKNKKYKKVLTP